MDLLPTSPIKSNRDGEHILIDLGSGFRLRLTLNQALALNQEVKREAVDMLNNARRAPVPACAQILPFAAGKRRA